MVRRLLHLSLLLCLLLPAGDVSCSFPPTEQDAPRDRPSPAVNTPRSELRAFWVDAWNGGIKTPDQIRQLIQDAQTSNVNTLIVQVRRRGDSYYNESLEPRAADSALDPIPFDPLGQLLEAAALASPPLQVYAWVVAFPVWTPTYTTTDTTRHVYFRHGYGRSWDDPDNWLTYRHNGGNPVADYQLDPGHPAAASYTVDVCLYLLQRYPIDGLLLDYIRYYGQDYGYNKVSVDRFNAAYGRSGLPDPSDPLWMAWRREQVTAVVRRLYLEALAVKPDLVLGAATIAWGDGPDQAGGWENTSAYRSVFQDWRAWLEEGILDIAMPMNYDREHQPPQDQYFRHWVEWEKDHPYRRGIAVAQGAWLNYITGTLTQTQVVQAPSQAGHYALGIGFYSYANTNAGGRPNSEFYQALSQPGPYGDPPFPTWVEPPTLTWKTVPTTGHLMGRAMGTSGPLDRTVVTLTSSVAATRTLLTDGSGFFGAVDLLPGDYAAEVQGADWRYRRLIGRVVAGRVTRLQPDTGGWPYHVYLPLLRRESEVRR